MNTNEVYGHENHIIAFKEGHYGRIKLWKNFYHVCTWRVMTRYEITGYEIEKKELRYA